ncbi:MAG TPA: HEAT repeat domain-containing protein [Gemmatimonadaceae bacterium]|nr:HEAT repeat domain-containing protein [Gemmatimonadaceae bacterium]
MSRVCAALALLLLAACHRNEPMAGGKPLSHWKREATKVSLFTFWNSSKDQRRNEAFRRLREIGEPAVPALVDLFIRKNATVSGDAFNALANLGPLASAAVPDMIEILQSDAPIGLRSRAAWILGAIGRDAEPAVPYLTPLLSHPTEGARRAAARALGQIGGAGHVALERAGLSDDHQTRAASMGGMAEREMSVDERRHALAKGLADLSPEVRIQAVELMMRIPREQRESLIDYLLQALNDPDARVKKAARTVFSAYRQHGGATPSLLAAVLAGGDAESRADAAWAMGSFGTPPVPGYEPNAPVAVNALTDALEDPDIKIRIYAGRALASGDGPSRSVALRALRRDLPNAAPIIAVRGARALWPADRDLALVRPVYERGLRDPERWNRVETISAILEMGPEADSFRPEFERLLSDSSSEVRDRAEKALSWLRAREGRPKAVEIDSSQGSRAKGQSRP